MSGRVIYKGKVQGKKKNHSKKMICDDCIKLHLCFQKVEEIQVLHVSAKGSWTVGLAVRYLDGHGG